MFEVLFLHVTQKLKFNITALKILIYFRGNTCFLPALFGFTSQTPPPLLRLESGCLTQTVNVLRVIILKRVILYDPAASIHIYLDLRLNSGHIACQEINLNSTVKLCVETHNTPNLSLKFHVCGQMTFSSVSPSCSHQVATTSLLGTFSLPAGFQPWHLSPVHF